jgi:hypothetical protein
MFKFGLVKGVFMVRKSSRRGFLPRRLDYYIKWSLSNWAEETAFKFCQEVLANEFHVRAYRYGYSAGRIPENLVEFEEILNEKAQLESYGKRPNLLLFDEDDAKKHEQELAHLMKRPDDEIEKLVKIAVLGLEVELSLWSMKRVVQAGKSLSFTVKVEDVQPLGSWQEKYKIPIVVLQVFLDELHACPLDKIINEGTVRKDRKTRKLTHFFPVSAQTRLTDIEGVYFDAKVEFTNDGALVPFVTLKGGRFINISNENLRMFEIYGLRRKA